MPILRLAPLLALALAVVATDAAARRHRHVYVHTHRYGRALSSAPYPMANRRQAPLNRPTLTERPVQPGATPLPAYLPTNAPPVFAPQPIP